MEIKCTSCPGEADVVYLPCGHKTLCRQCSDTRARCPLCGALADEKIQERDGFGWATLIVSSLCFLGVCLGLSATVILGATKGFLGISLRTAMLLVAIFVLFLGLSLGVGWRLKRVSKQIPFPLKAQEDLP